MSKIIDELKLKIENRNIKIVFPESSDLRILEAASRLGKEGLIKPILIGKKDELSKDFDLSSCEIIDPNNYKEFDKMVESFVARRKGKATKEQAQKMLLDENYFGTMLVYMGMADGLVSGACHSTGETVRPALQIIKTKPGVSRTFGYFLMVRNEEKYIFGDCAINPNPTAEQLAEIAISSAESSINFGIEPKIAMLSYSSGSSGKGEDVDIVRRATEIVKEKRPDLKIEGPIQYDAAVDATIGKSKMPNSEVAGQANVLIFPDLNTGNNTYKAVQRETGALAIGPMLQGLNKPVNDLSRGCTIDDIFNTVILTAIQAQGL